jgi:superfamily II DNA or RNA helicase
MAGTPGGPPVEDIEPHVPLPKLQDFQDDLRGQVLELLNAPVGANRAVLTLPTGAGKTRTTVEALIDWWLGKHDGDFILWIAQSDELCEQAVQAFREVWIDSGDPPRGVRDVLRIHRYWGTRQVVPDDESSGIIISTIDKLRSVLLDSGSSSRRDRFQQIVSELE